MILMVPSSCLIVLFNSLQSPQFPPFPPWGERITCFCHAHYGSIIPAQWLLTAIVVFFVGMDFLQAWLGAQWFSRLA